MGKYERLLAAVRARGAGPGLSLCFVIQRYGLEVAGGSELHCRWLAGRLAAPPRRARSSPPARSTTSSGATTTRPARDRWTACAVQRFPVRRPRSEHRFALISDLVFHDEHTADEERRWVEENGPYAPGAGGARCPACATWTCSSSTRTGTTRRSSACRTVAERAVLVPTAEEDPAIELPVFGDAVPRAARHRLPDARGALARAGRQRERVRAVASWSAAASTCPTGWRTVDVRARFGAARALPALRRAASTATRARTGCSPTTGGWREEWPDAPPLVLVGRPALPIPDHPEVRHLGLRERGGEVRAARGLRRAADAEPRTRACP